MPHKIHLYHYWTVILQWLRIQFELTRSGGGRNIGVMEGMRGFAVFRMFLVHYVTLLEPWIATKSNLYTLAGIFHSISSAGVDQFLVKGHGVRSL